MGSGRKWKRRESGNRHKEEKWKGETHVPRFLPPLSLLLPPSSPLTSLHPLSPFRSSPSLVSSFLHPLLQSPSFSCLLSLLYLPSSSFFPCALASTFCKTEVISLTNSEWRHIYIIDLTLFLLFTYLLFFFIFFVEGGEGGDWGEGLSSFWIPTSLFCLADLTKKGI